MQRIASEEFRSGTLDVDAGGGPLTWCEIDVGFILCGRFPTQAGEIIPGIGVVQIILRLGQYVRTPTAVVVWR